MQPIGEQVGEHAAHRKDIPQSRRDRTHVPWGMLAAIDLHGHSTPTSRPPSPSPTSAAHAR